MSRVGKNPINAIKDVKVSLKGQDLTVEGPKGKLEYTLPEGITAEISDTQVAVKTVNDNKELSKFHGLARALINNMMIGVSKGFEKDLEIIGVGYKAAVKGKVLNLQVGYSHHVNLDIWEDLTVTTSSATNIKVAGIDKQKVGEFAAQIRRVRPPEPYKGKGIRIAGEYVRRKAGKSMKK